MHSSRMRTARSSSHLGDVEQIPPEQAPPGCGPGHPPPARSPSTSLGCGPGDPPSQIPSTSPLVVGLEIPPGQIPLNFHPGCGPGNLQGMLGYQPPWRHAARHAGIPPAMHAGIPPPPPSPVNRMTDRQV